MSFEKIKKNFGFGCMRLKMDGDKVDMQEFIKMVDYFLDNGFNYFDKIAFWKTPIAEGGKFVPYSRWTQDYIAIMGGR